MTFQLQGSTAVVTGGARGIGLELSRNLIAYGCKVLAVGRNAENLESLRSEHPDAVTPIVADLSLQSEVDTLIARLARDHRDISILLNNAGLQTEMALLEDTSDSLIKHAREEIAVNLDALIALTIGLLPMLKSQKQVAVVNVSTGLAIAPKAASPVYCATKAGVRSFTKALRYQCADSAPHIQISEAVMAFVDTDMTQVRGSGKISAEQAAEEVIRGLQKQRSEIWIGKARFLPFLNRLSPRLVERMMR